MSGLSPVRLREMRWWDLDEVLAMERCLFPDDAWSAGMFWSELAHARGAGSNRRYVVAERASGSADRASRSTGPASGSTGPASGSTEQALDSSGRALVSSGRTPAGAGRTPEATGAGRIVGYAGFAASGELGDVQTIAVDPSHEGTGLGSVLLTRLLEAAREFACEEVLLEVRVDNARAQRLYERFGFAPIGFRRGYYQPGNVDALVMRREMSLPLSPPSAEVPQRPAPAGTAAPGAPGTPVDQTGTPRGTIHG